MDNCNPFWRYIKESNQVPFGVLRDCNDMMCPMEHISELSLVIPSVVQSLEMEEKKGHQVVDGYYFFCSSAFDEKAVRTVVDVYPVRYPGGKPSQSLHCSPGEHVYQIVNAGKRQSHSNL